MDKLVYYSIDSKVYTRRSEWLIGEIPDKYLKQTGQKRINKMELKHIYYFTYESTKRNTAGSKAPDDITQICKQNGFHEIVMPQMPQHKSKIYIKLWLLTVAVKAWRKAVHTIPEEAIVIFQHPSYGMRLSFRFIQKLQNLKKCKTIAIIHDLESLRGGIAGTLKTNVKTNNIGDNGFLKIFDAIVCHNDKMRQYLISQGFDPKKLVCLEIFDYLSEKKRINSPKGKKPSIAIAGNLAPGKCSYIYKILENENNKNLTIHLFGNNYSQSMNISNMVYHGSFCPEELPEHLIGDFGLVWDGPEAYTCAGNTGEYLKFNNPHKTSLYLSAGMPVIVWSQAAIAGYVKQNHVGIVIDSLLNLEELISEVTEQEYEKMKENSIAIAEKLKCGFYTNQAIEKAIEIIM